MTDTVDIRPAAAPSPPQERADDRQRLDRLRGQASDVVEELRTLKDDAVEDIAATLVALQDETLDAQERRERAAQDRQSQLEEIVANGGMVPLTVRRLSEFRAEPVHWLWSGRIPAGELTILAGDGGLGKSTFVAWLAAEVTTGKLRGLTGSRRVGLVALEDDPARTLNPRLAAAGADLDHVDVLGTGDDPVTLPADLDRLRDYVRDHRPDVLVIDPLGAALGGSVDAHRDGGKGGVRAALSPLARLAQEYRVTVLLVAHLNKAAGPASQRLSGSAGVRNAARNLLIWASHPDARQSGSDDGRRILGHDKCNYGPVAPSLEATIEAAPVHDEDGRPLMTDDGPSTTSLVRIGGDSDVSYQDALHAASAGPGEASGGEGRSTLEAACDFLSEALGGGPMSARDLEAAAKDAGVASRTLKRARAEVGVKSIKGANGWVVALPRHVGPLGLFTESPRAGGGSAESDDFEAAKRAKGVNPLSLAPLDDEIAEAGLAW